MEIRPQAMAIPKETDHLEHGKYGPIYPKTPACYGFSILAKIIAGRRVRGDDAEETEAILISAHFGGKFVSVNDRDNCRKHRLRWHTLEWTRPIGTLGGHKRQRSIQGEYKYSNDGKNRTENAHNSPPLWQKR